MAPTTLLFVGRLPLGLLEDRAPALLRNAVLDDEIEPSSFRVNLDSETNPPALTTAPVPATESLTCTVRIRGWVVRLCSIVP